MNYWASRTIAAGAILSSTLLLVTPSLAAPPRATTQLHVVKTLSSNFVGPLQFAVAGNRVFVADSFTSTLSEIGRRTPLATGPDPSTGGDLAGVAVDPSSRTLAYTTSNGDHSSTNSPFCNPAASP